MVQHISGKYATQTPKLLLISVFIAFCRRIVCIFNPPPPKILFGFYGWKVAADEKNSFLKFPRKRKMKFFALKDQIFCYLADQNSKFFDAAAPIGITNEYFIRRLNFIAKIHTNFVKNTFFILLLY